MNPMTYDTYLLPQTTLLSYLENQKLDQGQVNKIQDLDFITRINILIERIPELIDSE